MKIISAAVLSALFLTLSSAAPVRAQEEMTCEEWRCIFQEDLNSQCSCDESTNHGQWVSCVAHVTKNLVDQGLPKNCKGKIKRCAARSVCGKQDRGFATCTTTNYGTCVEGLCDTDGLTACTTNTECVAGTTCKITRHQEECTANGGLLNVSATCCPGCNVQ
jgi:hypothetical protein